MVVVDAEVRMELESSSPAEAVSRLPLSRRVFSFVCRHFALFFAACKVQDGEDMMFQSKSAGSVVRAKVQKVPSVVEHWQGVAFE